MKIFQTPISVFLIHKKNVITNRAQYFIEQLSYNKIILVFSEEAKE